MSLYYCTTTFLLLFMFKYNLLFLRYFFQSSSLLLIYCTSVLVGLLSFFILLLYLTFYCTSISSLIFFSPSNLISLIIFYFFTSSCLLLLNCTSLIFTFVFLLKLHLSFLLLILLLPILTSPTSSTLFLLIHSTCTESTLHFLLYFFLYLFCHFK